MGPEARNIGLLVVNRPRSIGEITDGTSNTIAIGEVSWRPLNAAGQGSDRQFVLGNVITTGAVNCNNNAPGTNGAFIHLRSTRKKLNGPVLAATNIDLFTATTPEALTSPSEMDPFASSVRTSSTPTPITPQPR